MNLFILLSGIFLAACLFCSLLWSAHRVYATMGRSRISHAIMAATIILTMAITPANILPLNIFLGIALIISAANTLAIDRGWSRLLAAPPAILGSSLAFGLPFSFS